jgi:glycolate oxidase
MYPTSMFDAGKDVVGALAAALSDGALVTDPDVMDGYRFDRASTVVPGRPVAVVRAADTADVQVTLLVAAAFGVPVVARGAGTGLSGGASALDGAITLSTERLRALAVDPSSMTATVGPGLLNVEVKAAAREHGLWYPPDPSSFEICSIGGNLATNAGGLCCVRYGVTGDYVLGIEVVLADGRAVRLGGRTVKDVAGYDLKRLFIGSEGTLGVITEATLRLRPAPPPTGTVVASFDDLATAGRAVQAITPRLRPTVLELMDRSAVAAVESVRPMGLDAVGALLLAQGDAGTGECEAMAGAFAAAGATYVAATDDAEEGELLMGARRMAVPCVERLGTVLIEDIGVPIPHIVELVTAIEEAAARHDTRVPVIGHAGDGNLHPLVTFDASDVTERARRTFDEILDAALRLGGTVSGEHGIGSLKARYLAAQLGPDVMALNRRVKAALDPHGILNPGKWT